MDDNALAQTETFLLAVAYTQPRILAMFMAVPIFASAVLPGMLRFAIAAAIGAHIAPSIMPMVTQAEIGVAPLLMLVAKEVFIGFFLGYLIAIPFWAFEAMGFLIDNQRGASVASTLNPLTGNDSSPLGQLFNQAFIVFFFISGGFLLMLGLISDSFRLWNVFSWHPHLHAQSVPLLLDGLSKLLRIAVLLGAPAIIAMFLAELGLALVSRFVPQLQVFFLAMPIKSAVAILVLALYMATLFDYGTAYVLGQQEILPHLDGLWTPGSPASKGPLK